MKSRTPSKRRGFNNAIECHICESPFAPCDVKHCDHCHFTSKHSVAAHEKCETFEVPRMKSAKNLNYTKSHSNPTVFHNISGCGPHFLIKSLATQ